MNLWNQRFEAHAVHPNCGNEVLVGTLMLHARGLLFESDSAVIEIPLERLRAEVREGDSERIVFSDPAQPGVDIFSVDLSLLECRTTPALLEARAQFQGRLQKREFRRRARILACFVAGFVLVTWLGSMAMGFMVRSIAGWVSPETDAKFGARVIEEFSAETRFLQDSNAVARLADLSAPLLRVLPPTPNGYQFHIAEDEEPNAFALPGGHIVVHTGLIKLTDRPEQLLAVIAHEMAHVTERHLYREQISMTGPLMVCEVFLSGRGGAMQAVGGISALVVGAGFSQEYETEADDVGWKYLVAANIDPSGMAEMLRKMKQYDDGAEGEDLMPQALSTHPAMDKRIKRIEAKWKSFRKRAGFVALSSEPILKN